MDATSTNSRSFAVTHARVLAIAGPMTLAHLTTPLLGVVGTAVIGQLGQAHLLGAVAVSAVVFDCIFWLFAFLRMGTVALTAQALGAGDAIEQRAVLARALVMAGCIGAGLLLLQRPISWIAYEAMGASAGVTEAAKIYFFVRIWSAPLILANYAVLGWLIGLARTDLALVLQVAINLVNLAATALSSWYSRKA
jgi:MATE family multidrug resistance protein